MLSKLSKIVSPAFGRLLPTMSTASMPQPIENPDIKNTGVSRLLKIHFKIRKKICEHKSN